MKEKVKVAIVDTGINKEHDYLKANIIGGIALESKDNYIIISENYDDENGHGTSCASIIKNEFENVEFFIVKALDRQGKTNIQFLEEALKYLLSVDVKIINLSLSVMESELVQDLYKVCEELKNQEKIIICSVANEAKYSYPAKFDNVIGVSGFILENDNGFWYNKDYDIECIMDNNSYLSCDINNSYKLFGKCNSQAAAKLTGKIANILSTRPNIKLDDLNIILSHLAIRNYWTPKDLEVSKRYPSFKYNQDHINKDIIRCVVDTIREVLHIDKDNNILYECGLFNKHIGLDSDNCFEVIKKLEKTFNLSLDYMKISRYDLVSIYTLADLVENNLNFVNTIS